MKSLAVIAGSLVELFHMVQIVPALAAPFTWIWFCFVLMTIGGECREEVGHG